MRTLASSSIVFRIFAPRSPIREFEDPRYLARKLYGIIAGCKNLRRLVLEVTEYRLSSSIGAQSEDGDILFTIGEDIFDLLPTSRRLIGPAIDQINIIQSHQILYTFAAVEEDGTGCRMKSWICGTGDANAEWEIT